MFYELKAREGLLTPPRQPLFLGRPSFPIPPPLRLDLSERSSSRTSLSLCDRALLAPGITFLGTVRFYLLLFHEALWNARQRSLYCN